MDGGRAAEPKYYVLDSYGENHVGEDNRMLLYSLPLPEDLGGHEEDHWLAGHKFRRPPKEPVIVTIQEGEEHADRLPYWVAPNVMSDAFYKALCDAGVDNLDVYDAILRSEDGTVEYKGFKAYNILGLIRAADLSKTQFSPGSRLIDASIESLAIDADKAMGILMFRLAENVSAVMVHERVKRVIEPMNFPYVQFTEPKNFWS
jgi:hypothetical protein